MKRRIKTNSSLGRKNTIFKIVNGKVFLQANPTVFNKKRMLLTEGNAGGKDFTFAGIAVSIIRRV
jgi:hypothetical protein